MKRTSAKVLSLLLAAFIFAGCTPFAFAKGSKGAYQEGMIIEFGSYPQTLVTDEATITALNSIDATENYYEGYYKAVPLNSLGAIEFKEDDRMMSYKDVEYNNEKYRGVNINSYRPWRTNSMSDARFSFQDDNKYECDTWYWFKYEPLRWKIFDAENGIAICDRVIDSQPYNSEYQFVSDGYYNYSSPLYYSNDFSGSQLCKWLNNDFLTTAFSTEEQNQIPTTRVDMSFPDGSNGSKRSVAISEKVVLLTYAQALDKNKADPNGYDVDYIKSIFVPDSKSTDYAYVQGENNNCDWWLVTPDKLDTLNVMCTVPSYDSSMPPSIVKQRIEVTSCGVRPVISFDVSEAPAGSNIINSNEDDTTASEEKTSKEKKSRENDDGPNLVLVGGIGGTALVVAVAGIIILKKKFI